MIALKSLTDGTFRTKGFSKTSSLTALAAGLLIFQVVGFSSAAHAKEILVGNYTSGFNGFPWAVAFAKGFFKEAGVDVTAIRSTAGGGANVRELIAGNLIYAEATVTEAVPAVQSGADIRMISQNTNNLAGMVWVTLPDSVIKKPEDFKGKKIGFTSPGSVSQALTLYMLNHLKFASNDVQMVATGGMGPGLTMLEHGGVDVMVLSEPLYTENKGKYRAVVSAETGLFPAFANGVGITTGKAARENADEIRAVIAARARAVDYMAANRQESAQLIAKQTGAKQETVLAVLNEVLDQGTIDGVPVYSTGAFDMKAINNIVDIARAAGTITGDAGLDKLIDQSFLPKSK